MNKSHLVKQWQKTYGEDFKRQYGGVFKKLPFHFSKKTLNYMYSLKMRNISHTITL